MRTCGGKEGHQHGPPTPHDSGLRDGHRMRLGELQRREEGAIAKEMKETQAETR
jgi:hypothetical protein